MIRREADIVWLDGVLAVEDAETLLTHVQEGAARVEWSGVTLLHGACVQVLLAARLPLTGSPANPLLARWLAPLLPVPPALLPTEP